jgi:hypothetical protein
MAIVRISKSSKPSEVKKALRKFASNKKGRKRIADFYGALPKTYEDGLTYQRKQRDDWE